MAMYKWIFPSSPICLRHGLTSFLDPKGTYCHDDPSYQKCSVCQPPPPPPKVASIVHHPSANNSHVAGPSSLKRKATSAVDPFADAWEVSKRKRVDREMEDLLFVDRMKKALEHFSGSCAYCQVHQKHSVKHAIISCPQLPGSGCYQYISWRDRIKYTEKFHERICFRCHVPQCHDQLHRTFVTGSGSCDYPDVVAPVAYGIYHIDHLKSAAEAHFKQTWVLLLEFSTWINLKPTKDKSNLAALLLWYYDSHKTLT
jgi:hypothetical protein